MIDLVRRIMPDAQSVELQHGTGRVRHLLITRGDGVARPCVLRRAPQQELALYRSVVTPEATGAPALLGWTQESPASDVYLLLEALPEQFPDFSSPADVTACYRHLAAIHINVARDLSPWAIYQAEVARVFGAFPESSHFARHAPLLQEGAPALIHGDYHRWNLLLQDHASIRVLDWEHAGLANPIWDLVLLAPEEPGWDGVPRGAMASHALQTYHEAGPFARLAYSDFIFRQRLARLFVAARWTLTHQAKAAVQPPGGPRDQILAYMGAERDRVKSLSALLSGA